MKRTLDAAVGATFVPWLAWWGSAATLAVSAALPMRRPDAAEPLTLDIVIPAHNEEAVIGRLLDSLLVQDPPARLGRVLVVADHCSDGTAEEARRHGADVLERNDGHPGKPPGLREGIAILAARADRGDAVVLIDADCDCNPGFLSAIAATLGAGAPVVQSAYTIDDPDDGAVRASLRRAFGLRNVVRAGGGVRFGLPCLLFGSGIALRWDVLPSLSFDDPRIEGTGDTRPVGDDVLMTLELLRDGHVVRFCPDAEVTAAAPPHEGDLGAQRLRWEAGQVMMWKLSIRAVPQLVRRKDLRGLVALLDWMNPPLAPTVMLFGGASMVAIGLVGVGAVSPTVLLVPAAAATALAAYLGIGVTVLEGPRSAVDLFVGAPRYLAWKARLYVRNDEARRTSTVVRTG